MTGQETPDTRGLSAEQAAEKLEQVAGVSNRKLSAALLLGAAALRQTTWQPIATAPKDGTRVLLSNVANEDRDAHTTAGQWQEADEDGPDVMGQDAGFVDVDYGVYSPGRSFGNPRYQSAPVQPTHWMPLPAAPVSPEGGQDQ